MQFGFTLKPEHTLERHLGLRGSLPLLWLRDRSDEFGRPASVDDPLRWLAFLVELPVPRRPIVRRVQYWVVEKRVGHAAGTGLAGGASRRLFD